MKNRAIFFDKDGVLNIDKGIQGNKEQAELYAGVGDLIAYFKNKKFKIFVVTNQPVVARGMLTEAELNKLFDEFQKIILAQNKKAIIDKIYYCPHHPNANVEKYRKNCECRKPKAGMLNQAAREFDIDLKNSYMVGDRISDIIAGYLAGCKTVHVMSGKHEEKMIETDLVLNKEVKPDFVISDILRLEDIVL